MKQKGGKQSKFKLSGHSILIKEYALIRNILYFLIEMLSREENNTNIKFMGDLKNSNKVCSNTP